MNMARIGNKYLADMEPWKLAKTDLARTAAVLNLALQIAANLEIAFRPFLPFSSEKLRAMLNLPETNLAHLGSFNLLEEGHELGEVTLLFEKIEDSVIQTQLDRLARIKAENEAAAKAEECTTWQPAPFKPDTTIDDFDRTDIRVGTEIGRAHV